MCIIICTFYILLEIATDYDMIDPFLLSEDFGYNL